MNNININFLSNQKGGNDYINLLKPIYSNYGSSLEEPTINSDDSTINSAQSAWNIALEKSKNISQADMFLIDTLESLISFNENKKIQWKIDGIEPNLKLLTLRSNYLKNLNINNGTKISEIKASLQKLLKDLMDKKQSDSSINELEQISALISRINEMEIPSNSAINLEALKTSLETTINKMDNNLQTNVQNNINEIQAIEKLIKEIDDKISEVKSTPATSTELIEFKRIEAQLVFLKRNILELAHFIEENKNKNNDVIEDANKSILEIEEELAKIVSALNPDQRILTGGNLEYRIPSENSLQITEDKFLQSCKGKKWDICSELDNIKNNDVKWVKAKLSMGWLSKENTKLTDNQKETLRKIVVLFKINRADNKYSFTKGKKAYLILDNLDSEDKKFLVTKLLDYNKNMYLINSNYENINYNIIDIQEENPQNIKVEDIPTFSDIYKSNLTKNQKKEKQKEKDESYVSQIRLLFNVFENDILKPIPSINNASEVTIVEKIYDETKLTEILPQSNFESKQDENGDIYYIDSINGKRYDTNFGGSMHFKVPLELTKFTLLDQEYVLSFNNSTTTSISEGSKQIIIPKDYILYYNYEINAFTFANLITNFRYWGIPLLEYSTDTFFVTYSPNYNMIYILDTLQFNDDDDDLNFVINSFTPDKFKLDIQTSILKIKEIERQGNNLSLLMKLFENIRELDSQFNQFKPKLSELLKKNANNSELLKLRDEIANLDNERTEISSSLDNLGKLYQVNYTSTEN